MRGLVVVVLLFVAACSDSNDAATERSPVPDSGDAEVSTGQSSTAAAGAIAPGVLLGSFLPNEFADLHLGTGPNSAVLIDRIEFDPATGAVTVTYEVRTGESSIYAVDETSVCHEVISLTATFDVPGTGELDAALDVVRTTVAPACGASGTVVLPSRVIVRRTAAGLAGAIDLGPDPDGFGDGVRLPFEVPSPS